MKTSVLRRLAALLVAASLLPASPLRAQDASTQQRPSLLGQVLDALIRSKTERGDGSRDDGRRDDRLPGGPRVEGVFSVGGRQQGLIEAGSQVQIRGTGFGRAQGQLAILPEGSRQWISVPRQAVEAWSSELILLTLEPGFLRDGTTLGSLAVIDSSDRSDVLQNVRFTERGGRPGTGGPGPTIYPPLPGGPGDGRITGASCQHAKEGIVEGQPFTIVGRGFGRVVGSVHIGPADRDDCVPFGRQSIMEWQDDHIVVRNDFNPLRRADIRVRLEVELPNGKLLTLPSIFYRSARSVDGDDYLHDHDHDKPGASGGGSTILGVLGNVLGGSSVPDTAPWSTAATTTSGNPKQADLLQQTTLRSLGDGRGLTEGRNSRAWGGNTLGLMVLGNHDGRVCRNYSIGIAAGDADCADAVASLASRAGSQGQRLKPTNAAPPRGGYPIMAFSGEALPEKYHLLVTGPKINTSHIEIADAQMLASALALPLPRECGRMSVKNTDVIAQVCEGDSETMVKCRAAEARNVTILAFLVRTYRPVILEGGARRYEIARSLRLCVIANGPHSSATINDLLSRVHVD